MLFELYSGASSVGPSGSSSSSLSMHPTRPTDHRLNRLSVSLECSFGRRRVVYRFLRAGLATPCLSEPGTIPLYLCYRQAIAFMQPSLQGCLHMAVSLAVCLTLSGCLSVLFSVCFLLSLCVHRPGIQQPWSMCTQIIDCRGSQPLHTSNSISIGLRVSLSTARMCTLHRRRLLGSPGSCLLYIIEKRIRFLQ